MNISHLPVAKILFSLIAITGIGAAGYLAYHEVTTVNFAQQEALDEETTDLTEQDGRMQRFVVENAEQRQAICNDGSPATYYFSPGSGEHVNDWIIHLQGGGGCSSPDECKTRWKTQRRLMTSKNQKTFVHGGGILSADVKKNPEFSTFNHVRINYCSSDFWSGDNTWEKNEYTIHFKGNKIITSVIEDLENSELSTNFTLDDADHVLFTGSSAGAAGAMSNLDRVAALLPFAEVRGVDDSAWSMDGAYPHYGDTEIEDMGDRNFYQKFVNPQVDDTCLEDYPDENAVACLNSRRLSPYLSTPFFLYMDQFDHFNLEALEVTNPRDPDQADYLVGMTAAMRDTFSDLDGVLSTRVGRHTGLTSSGFTTLRVDGHTYQELLTNWYFDLSGPKRAIAVP